MFPSIYLFIFCLQKMRCWTGDGLGQPSGTKTATKHKIQKKWTQKETRKKKQRFLGINKKLFIFPQVFFSKKKINELRHLQKWDKNFLFRWQYSRKHVVLLNLNWKKNREIWIGIQYQEDWETVNFPRKKRNSLKLWTEKWMEIPLKPLITPCVFFRRHHLC